MKRGRSYICSDGKKTLVLQSNENSFCNLQTSRDCGGGEPLSQVVSIERVTDGRGQKSKKIIYIKREKNSVKNGSSRSTSSD